MAAIEYAYVENNSNQTTTSSTFSNVVSFASGVFTAGKQYLVVATAQITKTTVGSGVFWQARLRHGTTDFGSGNQQEVKGTTARRSIAQWVFVWTAVSSEAVELQFASSDNIATVECNFASLFVMNLSDALAAGDWAYAERTNDDALSTTPLDGASITFTPAVASHDWLVMASAVVDPGATSTSPISRIDRSGEAASSLPEARKETEHVGALMPFMMSRVFNLGSASNTFKEQSFTSSGTAHTRLNSTIFALDLHKFAVHSNAYTEAAAALSSSNYATEIQTISITPAVTGDVWIGGYFGGDRNNVSRETEFRIQVDNTDQPAGQTTANYQFNQANDATDEEPFSIITLANLSNAAHAIDFDASADSATGAPAAQHRTLWAVTMELAGAPPPDRIPRPFISRWAVQRAASW